MRVDMEVLLECSTYVKHEKKYSIPTSSHVLFCLLYKHTNDDFFGDFPRIPENFSKIFGDSPKVVRPDNPFNVNYEK